MTLCKQSIARLVINEEVLIAIKVVRQI